MQSSAEVVVVGAGITGLALTHALRRRDISVVTLEADSRPGGVIWTDRVDGRVLEYGPQRLRLTESLRTLVSDLGLDDRVLYAPSDAPLYVLADGELREVPRSIQAFLRTSLLSPRGKLRILGEPFTRAGQPRESAGALLRRKFGAEAYRNIVEPLLGGIYASDPMTMPADPAISPLLRLEARERSLLLAALKRLRQTDDRSPVISFIDGLAEFPQALADRHENVIAFDTPATGLSPDDDGYRVETASHAISADVVVITTPAWVAADLFSTIRPDDGSSLTQLRYNPLAIVHLRADATVTGMGYQIRKDEPYETLGVTWNDPLFDRDGVYTAFLGGAWDRDIDETDASRLAETARQEFQDVMGVDAAILDVTILDRAIPAYDQSWRQLPAFSGPDGVYMATNYTGRIGVPGRLREADRIAAQVAAGLDDGKRL